MKNTFRNKRAVVYFIPAIIWGGIIAYYTLSPKVSLPEGVKDLNDKFLHGVIFFFSACLIYLGFIRYTLKNHVSSAQMWLIVLLCTLFGGAIELGQHYLVKNRQGEWLDFLANTLGAIVCVLVLRILHRGKRA